MSDLTNEILRRLERHPGDAPWSCVECYHGRPCIDSQILRAALSRVEIFDVLRKARTFVEQEADARSAAGMPESAYEREPVELLAIIDAALGPMTKTAPTLTIPRADYEALVGALKLCRVIVQHDRDLVDDLCDITAQNADDVTDRLDGFLADIDGALAKAAAP